MEALLVITLSLAETLGVFNTSVLGTPLTEPEVGVLEPETRSSDCFGWFRA